VCCGCSHSQAPMVDEPIEFSGGGLGATKNPELEAMLSQPPNM